MKRIIRFLRNAFFVFVGVVVLLIVLVATFGDPDSESGTSEALPGFTVVPTFTHTPALPAATALPAAFI